MEKKFIYKMIRNCLKQYYSESESLPLNDADLELLYKKMMEIKKEEPHTDLHEVVNDLVYEFLTNE